MNRLPRTPDDLRGLRVARWLRESTEEQAERYGPDAQRRLQDDSIRRLGMTDSGLGWEPAHSGATVYRSDAMAEMLAAAQDGAFDVLVVAYLSRWQRNLRQTLNLLEDTLHPAGVAVWFCDEEILSSNDRAWDQLVDEAKAAESWLRRHRRRVTEGYAAKFERHADPGGNPPLGFHRLDALMAPDPLTIGRAVAVFERYATGTVSLVDLEAESGIDREALKVMVRNPIYNGWVQRHRRGSDASMAPARWRSGPPVSDELWARVQEVRERRNTGGGHPTPRHVHPLAGLLYCVCGSRIRSTTDTKGGTVRRRYRHDRDCPHWDGASIRVASRFEGPIGAQISGIRVDAWVVANIRRLAETTAQRPDTTSLRRRQLERDLDDLARRHARRVLSTDAYLAEHGRLTGLLDAVQEPVATAPVVDPDTAVRWLKDTRRLWTAMDDEGRRDLARGIYDRITVTSEGVVSVDPTPDALRHGIAFALPETVLMARPEGLEPPASIHIVVNGRREWLRLARSA